MRRIIDTRQVPGGYEITIAREGAYTDGSSATEHVTVAVAPEATTEEIRAAIRTALRNPIRRLRGIDLDEPITETKAVWEARAAATQTRWEQWQWRIDHIAEYPAYAGLPAPQQTALLNALTNRRDAAAQADWDLLQAWRNAP